MKKSLRRKSTKRSVKKSVKKSRKSKRKSKIVRKRNFGYMYGLQQPAQPYNGVFPTSMESLNVIPDFPNLLNVKRNYNVTGDISNKRPFD